MWSFRSVAAILYYNADVGFKIFDSNNARDYLYGRSHPWVLLGVLERVEHTSDLHHRLTILDVCQSG